MRDHRRKKCSLIAKPNTKRAMSSAMMTAVKIWTPTGCLSLPSSMRTLATSPLLERESTLAMPKAWVKLRPSFRSMK